MPFLESCEHTRIAPDARRMAAIFWPPPMPGKGVGFTSHVSPQSFDVSTGMGCGPRMNERIVPSDVGTTAGWMTYLPPAALRMSPFATFQVWPRSLEIIRRSSTCTSPSQAKTSVPSFAWNAEHGWLRRSGASRVTMILGCDQVTPLSSDQRMMFDALSQPNSDCVQKWKMRLPSENSTGAWSLMSGTSKNKHASSHLSAPARNRVIACAISRPDSVTQVYQ